MSELHFSRQAPDKLRLSESIFKSLVLFAQLCYKVFVDYNQDQSHMTLLPPPISTRKKFNQVTVRNADEQDRQAIANLMHFETFAHRHLDWRRPLDWIGFAPFLVAERSGEVIAAFACPPDPADIAWLRLFAVTSHWDTEKAWEAFWPSAQDQLVEAGNPVVAAIPLQPWLKELLAAKGFRHTHDIVSLAWENRALPAIPAAVDINIRPTNYEDLPRIAEVDEAAFGPMWRNSLDALEIAFWQSVIATVAEWRGPIIGYQISTASPMGGHLARLAVHPEARGQGIGYSLLWDLLDQFHRRGALHVTVNTQKDNASSLKLYEKVGFHHTGEEYPVYQFLPKWG